MYAAPRASPYLVRLDVTDDDGAVGHAARPLTVVDQAGAMGRAVQDLVRLAGIPGLPAAARNKLQSAVDDLQGNNNGNAHNGALDKLASCDLNAALVKIAKALRSLDAAAAAAPSLNLAGIRSLLALTAKAAALDALARARAAMPPDPTSVAKAAMSIAEGDALLAAGRHGEAVDKYREAIQRMQHLL